MSKEIYKSGFTIGWWAGNKDARNMDDYNNVFISDIDLSEKYANGYSSGYEAGYVEGVAERDKIKMILLGCREVPE